MNINKLSTHIEFDSILSQFKKENGKIDWYSVSNYKNLPTSLIDKYFNKLRFFHIEIKQNLSNEIIFKYRYKIDLRSLFISKNIDESLMIKLEDIIEKKCLWYPVFAYQKLSEKYVMDHLDKIKSEKNFIVAVLGNIYIDENVKNLVKAYL